MRARGLEHHELEERGLELVRLLAQAHQDLRALREQRRDDVRDAGGGPRRTAEDGPERTRVMIFGPVATSRIAYRIKSRADRRRARIPAGQPSRMKSHMAF